MLLQSCFVTGRKSKQDCHKWTYCNPGFSSVYLLHMLLNASHCSPAHFWTQTLQWLSPKCPIRRIMEKMDETWIQSQLMWVGVLCTLVFLNMNFALNLLAIPICAYESLICRKKSPEKQLSCIVNNFYEVFKTVSHLVHLAFKAVVPE